MTQTLTPRFGFAVTVSFPGANGRIGYSHVWHFNGADAADACERARKFLGYSYAVYTAVKVDRDDSFDNGCQ